MISLYILALHQQWAALGKEALQGKQALKIMLMFYIPDSKKKVWEVHYIKSETSDPNIIAVSG